MGNALRILKEMKLYLVAEFGENILDVILFGIFQKTLITIFLYFFRMNTTGGIRILFLTKPLISD